METTNLFRTGKELMDMDLTKPSPGKYRYRASGQNTFGDWEVDEKGNMEFKNYYFISAGRLNQKGNDWMLHLFEKRWIVWDDFVPAYFQACRNAGIKEVQMKMFY